MASVGGTVLSTGVLSSVAINNVRRATVTHLVASLSTLPVMMPAMFEMTGWLSIDSNDVG